METIADISEEVARFYGYENIPSTVVRGEAEGLRTPQQKFSAKLGELSRACGYNEVITYSFISPKYYDKINLPADSPLRRCVTISNPLGEDSSVMRTTGIPSVMEVVARNYNNKISCAKVYEIARKYLDQGETVLPEEKEELILAAYGPQEDFYTLKGAVETILSAIGIPRAAFTASGEHPTFHPGRCAVIETQQGDMLGIMGELHPLVLRKYGISARACVACLDISELFAHAAMEKQYTPLPKFPALERDLALICEDDLPVAEIEKIIRGAAGERLESLRIFDLYRGPQVEEGKKSVAYELILRSQEETLTDATADALLQNVLNALSEQGITLRS